MNLNMDVYFIRGGKNKTLDMVFSYQNLYETCQKGTGVLEKKEMLQSEFLRCVSN